jgi:hypothetical protein
VLSYSSRKKNLGILRICVRGTHAVYAGSFQTFEPPAPAVGFLYLISKFCIRRPGAVRAPDLPRDLTPLPLPLLMLSSVSLLGGKLSGFDLPVTEVAGHMRLAEPGDDVVVNGCKAKQHIKAAQDGGEFGFDSPALREIERQRLWDRDSFIVFLRESLFFGGFKLDS